MKIGDALPSFGGTIEWLDGPVTPSQLAGRPVLVHFWSTGCPLCHDGVDVMARWRDRFRDLIVIAACQPRTDEAFDAAAVKRVARESMKIAYPCAIDSEGTLARRFDSVYPPGYYLFDAAHRLRHRQMGNAHLEVMEALLERLTVKASTEREAY